MRVNILTTTMTKSKIPRSCQHVVGVLSILTWRHDKKIDGRKDGRLSLYKCGMQNGLCCEGGALDACGQCNGTAM
jgi:hypothetical protein